MTHPRRKRGSAEWNEVSSGVLTPKLRCLHDRVVDRRDLGPAPGPRSVVVLPAEALRIRGNAAARGAGVLDRTRRSQKVGKESGG